MMCLYKIKNASIISFHELKIKKHAINTKKGKLHDQLWLEPTITLAPSVGLGTLRFTVWRGRSWQAGEQLTKTNEWHVETNHQWPQCHDNMRMVAIPTIPEQTLTLETRNWWRKWQKLFEFSSAQASNDRKLVQMLYQYLIDVWELQTIYCSFILDVLKDTICNFWEKSIANVDNIELGVETNSLTWLKAYSRISGRFLQWMMRK